MNALLAELKRRKVLSLAGMYVVTSWLILQIAEILIPALQQPDWALSLVFLMLMLGFPIALICSWAVDLTPDGIKLETDRTHRVSGHTLAVLAVSISVLGAFAGYHIRPLVSAQISNSVSDRAFAIPAIAVLPFVNMTNDPSDDSLADGLTEELLNALVAQPDLNVVARTSAYAYKDKGIDLRLVGRALSASHIIEGSVRRVGDRLRITAQLISADTGYHLWSQSFEASLIDLLQVQISISQLIAKSLSDTLAHQAPPKGDAAA